MQRLKVLLLRPNSKADELIPPFGLGYLATAIRENYDVQILDGIKEKLTLKTLADLVKREKFDVIGIQVFTHHINTVKDYIKTIKAISSEVCIILGGPHPSCSPEDIFEYFPDASFAFKGEAEIGLSRLLDLIGGNKNPTDESDFLNIPGLIWRDKNGRIVINSQIFEENLDNLGSPSWDLLRPDAYPLSPHGAFFKNYPIAPIIITRGCPYSCTYCAGRLVSGRIIRARGIDSVIEEIKLLRDKYGIKEIHIEDDNFTFKRDLVREFCNKLKINNLNISWACPNGIRLDTLDDELLSLMKSSGLYSVSVGIESGSDRVLAHMRKGLTKDKIKEKVDLIKKAGLGVIGFFIIGYPAETREDILETINFAKKLNLKRANFMIFKPFPGTPITEQIARSGELKDVHKNWDKYILADAVYAPAGMYVEELKSLRRKALLGFYLRPKILFGLLAEIKNFTHFKIVLKRIFRWIFK